jgi:dihydroflavonol-4-reductase
MPDFLSMFNAYLFTGLSNLIKKPPLWGMSVDQMKTMKEGFCADGSKAERELGITYTPIKKALEEQIASII